MIKINPKLEAEVKKILSKVPQETLNNPMMVGKEGNKCFYNLHNHRLYFDFNRKGFLYKPYSKKLGFIKHKVINKIEHIFIHDDYTIWVKKKQVIIQNKMMSKKWFPIDVSTNASEHIGKIIKEYYDSCILLFKAFIKVYGGSSNFNLLNATSENKVKGERAIDYIPLKMRFHNDIVKKVYNESNVEFQAPPYAATYLSNRAIEEVAPEIAYRLKSLEENQNTLKVLKSRIGNVDDVLKEKELVLRLSNSDKLEFSDWIFQKFSIFA